MERSHEDISESGEGSYEESAAMWESSLAPSCSRLVVPLPDQGETLISDYYHIWTYVL